MTWTFVWIHLKHYHLYFYNSRMQCINWNTSILLNNGYRTVPIFIDQYHYTAERKWDNLVYCNKQFGIFFGLWRHHHVKTPLWRHFYRQMPLFFENVWRRQILLNLYLFLCNLAIALAFMKIWRDKTKLSKRFN